MGALPMLLFSQKFRRLTVFLPPLKLPSFWIISRCTAAFRDIRPLGIRIRTFFALR